MMKKNTLILLVLISTILMAFCPFKETPASIFINSLSKEQKAKALFPFEHESKTFWHYFPVSMAPRAGIELKNLNTDQKKLFKTLLQSFISETGYNKTQNIIALENVLLEETGDSINRDPEKYLIAFYGNPETDDLWAWSFEGHHISLNFTVDHDYISIAPRFLGANPAKVLNGPQKGKRALANEEDLGFELINSLSNEQKKNAIFQERSPYDIASANSQKVEPLAPTGILFGELNEQQQIIFLKLINEYLSTMPKEQADQRLKSIQEEDLNSVRFGWAGATNSESGHYYRIQGTSFLIEFDNTQNNANHIHSVWRDFEGDFGRDLIQEHYKNSSHHQH